MTGEITLPFGETLLKYPTLENADFIIPAGTYPLSRTWSPRFKKLLPLVENVPEREGIRIIGAPENFNFWGERRTRETYRCDEVASQSEGFERDCILTNYACMADFNSLFNRIEKFNDLFEEDEEICICITDPA